MRLGSCIEMREILQFIRVLICHIIIVGNYHIFSKQCLVFLDEFALLRSLDYNLTMDIFQNLGNILATAGLLLTSLFNSSTVVHHKAIHAQHSVTQTVVTPQSTMHKSKGATQSASLSYYTASRSIEYQHHTIDIMVNIPKDGGQVTGTVSGDCNGNITGQYDGKEGGSINGQVGIYCKLLFIQIPGTATFSGTVSKANSLAELYVTIESGIYQGSQNVFINLQ